MVHNMPQSGKKQGLVQSYLTQQITLQPTAKLPLFSPSHKEEPLILPAISAIVDTEEPSASTAAVESDELEPSQATVEIPEPKRLPILRLIALGLVLTLASVLYYIWSVPSPQTTSTETTQQNFSSNAAMSSNTLNTHVDTSAIQVYIVGAVKHPGVYRLATGARVYELLQAAGGPLPDANLVALNLAARLNDAQEIYVPLVGETPPAYQGGVPGPASTTVGNPTNATTNNLVNINTATASEMQQTLHISSTSAQNIINYRTQHGPFSSIDQLLQVISRTTYDKIKAQITV